MGKLKLISRWLDIRNFLFSKSSKFTKKEAIKIAKEHNLKAEVVLAMKHGCSPDEALLVLDIYPYAQKSNSIPLHKQISRGELIANIHDDLLENLAINDSDLCYEVLKSKYEEELNIYSPTNRPPRTPEENKRFEKTRELDKLNVDFRKTERAIGCISEKVILGLKARLEEETEISERIAILKDWISDYCNDIPIEKIVDIYDPVINPLQCESENTLYKEFASLIINHPDSICRRLTDLKRTKIGEIASKIEIYKYEISQSIEEEEQQRCEIVEQFINKLISAHNEKNLFIRNQYKKDAERILEGQLGESVKKIICNYLSNCNEDEIRNFATACLSPEELAARSTVDIVVKRLDKNLQKTEGIKKTGNTGNYLIYTQKEGEDPIRLKFSRQASMIYYLMYLIDHCNRDHDTCSIDLRRNRASFMELYDMVYYIGRNELSDCYEDLLRSKDRHGDLNGNGRKFLIYDIKIHVREAFERYDEDYLPYIMTAKRHLSVNKKRIIFDDNAKDLLNIRFY